MPLAQMLSFVTQHKTGGWVMMPGMEALRSLPLPKRGDAAVPFAHSIPIQSERVFEVMEVIPGFAALVRAARRERAGGLELLHGWLRWRKGGGRCHHDRVEEFRADGVRDRVIDRSVVISLSGGGRTATRVVGCAPTRCGTAPGSALSFRSGLWREACPLEEGEEPVIEVALMFGSYLEPEEAQWMMTAG